MTAVVCVDFGSTFTKAGLVDLEQGTMVAAASHPTTLPSPDGTGDVLDGYDACLASLVAQDARAADAEVLACSSAGGGLRIAVVGNEELVTAEAGRRVALSSGGKVVAVRSVSRGDDLADLEDPDVVLLTGGTDGGNADPLLAAARGIVDGGWRGPVVVAGNAEAQTEVAAILAGLPVVVADNVVPRIGVLAPDSARAAIREMFLSHVIGGKHLSTRDSLQPHVTGSVTGPVTGSGTGSVTGSVEGSVVVTTSDAGVDSGGGAFTSMVRGATPDVVLTGVELLSRGLGPEQPGAGDVVVVDIGGATTDVHSVVELDPETTSIDGHGLARDVVALTPVTRTVEGDLGMRWSAVTTIQEAGLTDLAEAAARRHADPAFLPSDDPQHEDQEREVDEAIARAAVGLALKRHAGRSKVVVSPEGRVVERTGKDLREVDLLVGSGGVLRHGADGVVRRVLAPSTGEHVEGGWQLPRAPRVVVDRDYVLAAAGLLVADHPEAAHRLVQRLATGADE